jgi:hypothetical protein
MIFNRALIQRDYRYEENERGITNHSSGSLVRPLTETLYPMFYGGLAPGPSEGL